MPKKINYMYLVSHWSPSDLYLEQHVLFFSFSKIYDLVLQKIANVEIVSESLAHEL